MKVGFFLLKFPLSSETFVLNQITAFIDMGFEVEIVALQKGDTQNTHAAWTKYNLAARTRWLQDVFSAPRPRGGGGGATRQSGETAPPRQPDVARYSS